jgi:hypothetical protein
MTGGVHALGDASREPEAGGVGTIGPLALHGLRHREHEHEDVGGSFGGVDREQDVDGELGARVLDGASVDGAELGLELGRERLVGSEDGAAVGSMVALNALY